MEKIIIKKRGCGMKRPEIVKTVVIIALAVLGAGASLCLMSDKAQGDTWASFLLVKLAGMILLGGALSGYFWLESHDQLPKWLNISEF